MKLAVGFFDGVHLGHRRILSGADAALTFSNHPSTILAPEKTPPLLMPLNERLAAISAALPPKGLTSQPQWGQSPFNNKGPDPRVVALEFTEAMKGLSPLKFIDFLKREYADLEAIRCGPNWRFGEKGSGNAEFARAMGLQVEEVPFVMHDGEAVSSTRIRNALAAGNVRDAALMLGRDWSLSGRIFAGKGEGRKMGFPTLNVKPFEGSVPLRRGVYVVNTQWGRAVANWGLSPTMGKAAWKECVLEVHILGNVLPFEVPSEMTVSFLRFLREERTFADSMELVRQIADDCGAASES